MIELFTHYIENHKNFTFTKFGDGEIICMLGRYQNGDTNCDKQSYSKILADKLWESANIFSKNTDVFIGKWEEIFSEEFEKALDEKGISFNYAPYGTFLHIVQNDLDKVMLFYKALKSAEKKVYVCPGKLNQVKSFLNCKIITVQENEAFSDYEMIKELLLKDDFNIFLYSAGLMSKVLISDILKIRPDTTHIDIGSGLDNLFFGITRSHQVSTEQLKDLYSKIIISENNCREE
jgi:hypothetical protein